MKRIGMQPAVRAEIRAIDQRTALHILETIHRYAECGAGDVVTLQGPLAGRRRLRVGDFRVIFTESEDSIEIHRVGHRRDVYR